MPEVICDTSPLQYLHQLGLLDLLPNLYGRVIVPRARAACFERHGPRHPVTVAELDGRVVGWGSLSPFHPRSAYRRTVENSVYVSHEHQRRGIGRALLADLIERASAIGHHTIIAGIDSEQAASVALHAAFGFTRVAYLAELGYKFGRWLNVIYMQRMV